MPGIGDKAKFFEMNTELRRLLENVPKERCDEQENILNDIRNIHKHSISTRDSTNLFKEWGTYNCYEYALGLTDFPNYDIVKKQGVFGNSAFIKDLLDNNRLIEQSDKNGLIIYFSHDNQPEHAGKLIYERVLSKWGTGLLFDHEIFEVPLSYGTVYSIYKTIEATKMLQYFYDYAEVQGIKFEGG